MLLLRAGHGDWLWTTRAWVRILTNEFLKPREEFWANDKEEFVKDLYRETVCDYVGMYFKVWCRTRDEGPMDYFNPKDYFKVGYFTQKSYQISPKSMVVGYQGL